MKNCDEEKLNRQKEYLKDEIYKGKNDTYFKVIDLECGTGKSRSTEEIMAFDCIDNSKNKYLYVVERNSSAIESAKRINKLAKKTIAIAVNTDTLDRKKFNEIKYKLKDYKVVIISHEKYKVLAADKRNRKYFNDSRNTLIVDEFLNMCKGNVLSLNKEYLNKLETRLQYREIREQFALCIKEIEDYLLMEKPIQSFFNAKTDIKIIGKQINHVKKW